MPPAELPSRGWAPPSRLARLERLLLAGRRGFLRHRQQHRHRHVAAGHRGQIDDLLVGEQLFRPREQFVRDAVSGRKLGDEVVHHRLILRHGCGTLVGFQFGNDLRRQARLLRQRRVGIPLDLGAPLPADDQDRELVQPGRH